MRDEYEDRLLNENRQHTSGGIDRLLHRIMQAFRVLHRITWSAPWTPQPRERECEC